MRVLRVIPPIAACLLAALLTAGPARAATGMEIALQDDHVFVGRSYYDRELAFQQARRLGVSRLRVNVSWSRTLAGPDRTTRPFRPAYDWAPYDDVIAAAARYGIGVQFTLVGPAPAWATADRRVGFRQVSPAAFGRFAADAAAYFRGRVGRYSIWNEPNWHTLLQPSARCRKRAWGRGCDSKLGALYRKLYTGAYTQIKRADPAAQVLIGELAPRAKGGAASSPLSFLRALTCSQADWNAAGRCGRLYADGFAQHPYDFTVEPSRKPSGRDDVTMATLGRLNSALDRLARRRALSTRAGRPLPVYLTEHGYFASGSRKIPESRRVAYLRQSFDIALRHPRVRQLLQYLLVAPPDDRDTFPTQIVDAGGRPFASFDALAGWARENAGRIATPLPVRRPRRSIDDPLGP